MKIIEKIEIHRFRSISNTSIEADEINIFSGINNSGKSNILKALNLFFNRRSSFDQQFDFVQDYNQAFTGHAGGKRAVEIILHFSSQGKAALNTPFSISRTFEAGQDPKTKYRSTDKNIQQKLEKNDGNIYRQFTTFLHKIEYFYIPAVRDKKFVQSLFLHFEKLIEHDSGKAFKANIEALSRILNKKSEEISTDFEQFIGLPTRAALSSKITDLLGTVEINVKTGIKIVKRTKSGPKDVDVEVNLFSSGDGILMSYLAYFLAHVCKKISNKMFIWGFEEPENSLEYSKVQQISEEFYGGFRNNAQIFITTHSPAFINLKDRDGVNFYRVYINVDDKRQVSEIRTINDVREKQQSLFASGEINTKEYKKLSDELNFVEFSKEIESAVKRVQDEEKVLVEAKSKFEKENAELLRLKPAKVFVCEDSDKVVIQLWEQWLNFFKIKKVRVMSSSGSTTKNIENWVRQQMGLSPGYSPKIFRQIDRGGLTDEQIKLIENKLFVNDKKDLFYEFKFFPVFELENFLVIKEMGIFTDQFWADHKDVIVSAFERTASAKCKSLCKEFDVEKETLEYEKFIKKGDTVPAVQEMRAKAKVDWRKHFPGKEICAQIPNFNVVSRLKTLTKDELPIELKGFMLEVKKFFESKT